MHTEARKYPHDTSSESSKRKFNDGRTSVSDDRKLYENEKIPHDDRRYTTEEADNRRGTSLDDRRSTTDGGRRGLFEKRRPPVERRPQYDDDYELEERTPKRPIHDSKPEIIPKVRSSSGTASIFNRPRTPPKINRPVPNNEKKKYEYTSQKQDKITTPTPLADDELYDDEYDYEADKSQPDIKPAAPIENKKSIAPASQQREQRPLHRNEFKDDKSLPTNSEIADDEDFELRTKVSSIKPQRSAAPKIEPQQQSIPSKIEFYDDRSKEVSTRPNPKPAIDFNKDEYIPDDVFEYADEEIDDRMTKTEEIHHQPDAPRTEFRPIVNQRLPEQQGKLISEQIERNPKPLNDQEEIIKNPYPQQENTNLDAGQYKTKFHRLSPPATNIRTPTENFPKEITEPEDRDVYRILTKETAPRIEPSGFKPVGYGQDYIQETDSPKNRPYVRIMKRPFLPSRGGSIYLPRGLKPVGGGITTSEYTTENIRTSSSPANMGNLHLFEHNLPINHHQTTQSPQIESPRSPLDEIFNNDYDVTLNDALNPTLKPLSQSHESPIGFTLNKFDRANPYARADVSHAPSQHRTTTIQRPQLRHTQPIQHQQQSSHTQTQSKAQPQIQAYDDEYDY